MRLTVVTLTFLLAFCAKTPGESEYTCLSYNDVHGYGPKDVCAEDAK